MPELSIIVPVYKVEKYLPKCIDSILAQTFRDFELILIDDGSPDNCGAICDDYAARDSRIKVIHQENAGVSAARNAGLDIATGTYLGFVDSDDWIEPEMYETMIAAAKEKNVDVVVCDVMVNDDAGNFENLTINMYDPQMLIQDLFSKPSKLHGYCVNKLYRRERLSECRFLPDIKIWEDLTFMMDFYIVANPSGMHINRDFYHYRFNMESATQSKVALFYGHHHFREYIFRRMKAYSPSYAGLALDYFLDSSLQLICSLRKGSSVAFLQREMGVARIKTIILAWVFYGKLTNVLPKKRRHRYLYEGVIKS